jgi:muramoyltetrapeptide carboxypeptidase
MTSPLTIGVFSPASYVEPHDIARGVNVLKEIGFETVVHEQAYERLGQTQLSGTPERRAQAYHELVKDSAIHAITAAGGGNDTAEMLDHIDYTIAAAHPKPVIGFSDVTALLCALFNHAGIKGIHAPVLKLLGGKQDTTENRQALQRVLSGTSDYDPLEGSEPVISGHAEGRLIGGNLCIIDALFGTSHLPDLHGTILFIEDCDFELNDLNRKLTSWRQRGIFDQIQGLIIGSLSDNKDSGRPFGFNVEAIIKRHFSGFSIPVIKDAPFGHEARNLALPFGTHCRLEAAHDHCTLSVTP